MKIENVQVQNVTDECIIWLQDWLGKGGDVKVGFSIFMIPEILMSRHKHSNSAK